MLHVRENIKVDKKLSCSEIHNQNIFLNLLFKQVCTLIWENYIRKKAK